MDKFRISAFVIILITIILSLYKTLTQNNSESANDYHPDTKDKNITNKIMWYFSQITYQSEFLILIYFGLRIFTKYKFDILFATIAPYCLTKNIHYFYLLYPKYAKKLIQIKTLKIECQNELPERNENHLFNTPGQNPPPST